MNDNPIARVPRLVVVQPAAAEGHPAVPLPVGVATFMPTEPRLAVIVKVTYAYGGPHDRSGVRRARLAATQLGLGLDEPSLALDARPNELYYANDFAPRKAAADLLVVGHAHALEPTDRIAGRFAAAGLERRFAVRSAEPATAIALSFAALEPDASGEIVPLGPAVAPGHDDVVHGDGFDYGRYGAAHPWQRVDAIDPAGRVELEGLVPGGERSLVDLPGLEPRATVADPWRGRRVVPLRADTLWLDVDRELVVVVWRGDVEVVENGRELERIVVSLERAGKPRPDDEILPLLQRGSVAYAIRAVDLAPEAEPVPKNDEVLRMHRFRTWRSEAPAPELTVEEYAVISAELGESTDGPARARVLERHDFDEERWLVEERGWLDQMARSALQGDGSIAAAYSERFVEAQDALARPAELARTFDEFLAVAVAMTSTAEPAAVLRAHELTLPMWLRMNRRFQAKMARDPELAERYRTRLAEAEAVDPPLPDELA